MATVNIYCPIDRPFQDKLIFHEHGNITANGKYAISKIIL